MRGSGVRWSRHGAEGLGGGESYRKFVRHYGKDGVEEKLRERWFDRMVTPEKAVHCFVGNVAARPKTFLLLGLFYPRRDVVEELPGEPVRPVRVSTQDGEPVATVP